MPQYLELHQHKVTNAAPLDDMKRPYWPEWTGAQTQQWLKMPAMGVSFLIRQFPTTPAKEASRGPIS